MLVEITFIASIGRKLLNLNDLKIESLYSQTRTTEHPGGQHAGVAPMFVRITHIPTYTVAECGCMRSQFRNKQVAMAMIEMALVEMNFE